MSDELMKHGTKYRIAVLLGFAAAVSACAPNRRSKATQAEPAPQGEAVDSSAPIVVYGPPTVLFEEKSAADTPEDTNPKQK